MLSGTKIQGKQAVTEFYTDADCDVIVNGNRLTGTSSGNGMKYVYSQLLEKGKNTLELMVKKGSETITYSTVVGGQAESCDTSDRGLLTVSDTGTVISGENGAEICVKSKGNTVTEKLSFKPFFCY